MKLGLGTAQLGLDYGIANNVGKPSNAAAMAILCAAANGGIDCFDTAAGYGNSEEIIGKFIYDSGVNVKVCTKFSSCESAESDLEESLERLGAGRIDYFLLHKAEQVFLPEFSEVLESIRRNPAVGKVGASIYNAAELEECLKHSVQVVQIPFNILDSRLINSGVLERAKVKGIEIHARSIYLQGLLLGESKQKPLGAEKYLKQLREFADNKNVTLKELCFLYVRDYPLIDKFFIGCETVEQVQENLKMYELQGLELAKKFGNIPDEILNPALWNEARLLPQVLST